MTAGLSTVRRIVAARDVRAATLVVLIASVLCWRWGDATIVLDFAHPRRGRTVYFAEVFGVVTGATLAALLRPRMIDCERLGGLRTRAVAATFVAFGIVAAVVPVAAAVPSFVEQSPWQYMLPNILTLTALAFLLAALISPAVGSAAALLAFAAMAVLQNIAPAIMRSLPFGQITEPGVWFDAGTWSASIVLCIIAITVHFATHGAAATAQNLTRNN